MKKIFMIVLLISISFSGVAFAENNESTPGRSFTVNDGQVPANELTFNFSPGVVGEYNADGLENNRQWYSIGTYHGGGTNFYATTSGVTAIFRKPRTTDEKLADAGVPKKEALQEGTDAQNKPIGWSDGWSK